MASDHHTVSLTGDQLPDDLHRLYRERIDHAGEPEAGEIEPILGKLPEVKAVLFDVYGTLVQSAAGEISLHTEGERSSPFYRLAESIDGQIPFDRVEAIAEAFYEQIEELHAAKSAFGVSYPEVDIITVWHALVERFPELGNGGQGGDFAQARWLALRYELEANPVAPMPGALETIQGLRSAGILLGVISNAQFYTPLLFPLLFGGNPEELGFAHTIWSYLEGEAKPSIALFERGADWFRKAYNLEPDQILMVGNDMLNDIAPAAQVGMRTALFGGDRRSLRLRGEDPRARGVEPNLVITALTQLLEVFS